MEDSELLHRLDERSKQIATKVDAILDQTTLTNGRVTDLERWRDVLKGQWRIVVFFAVGFGSAMGYLIKHFWG